MENSLKMPASYTEINSDEMEYTEGGSVTVIYTPSFIKSHRGISRYALYSMICSNVGVNTDSALGKTLYGGSMVLYNKMFVNNWFDLPGSLSISSPINANVILSK